MSTLPLTNKSLGQHWLTDRACLKAICDAAELEPSDTVLEIGPGLGTLTELLVARTRQVIAVEFDKALVDALPSRVTASNLHVEYSDILRFNFTTVPAPYKVVANIPYYLTSNLIRVLSETPNAPITAVLLVQQEVAERVAAKPGDMSILAVTAQFYWEVSLGRKIGATFFTPPPKVDSQIIILKRRTAPLFSGVDVNRFFRLVKAGFSQRRKTLHNSLSGGLQLERKKVSELLLKSGIDPSARAQTLSLEAWYALYISLCTVD